MLKSLLETWTVKLVRERHADGIEAPKVRGPEDAARLLWSMFEDADREMFVALYLDSQHVVRGVHVVSVGTLDASVVHPREVFKPAILANAAAVIVAHNHPSGDPTPSAEDRAVTKQLVEAGRILGIPVLDHLVVGAKPRFRSLVEQGAV